MRVITVCQKKGGNGKSTSVQNLSAAFARRGKRVLAVDLDEQGNTSSTMGIGKGDLTVDEVLMGGKYILQGAKLPVWKHSGIVCPVEYAGTRGGLSGVVRKLDGQRLGHRALADRIEKIEMRYDYCFIDTSPSMNILTLNALCTADYVFIPLSSKYFSLLGLVQTLESIEKVNKRLGLQVSVLGMGFVIHDGRSGLAREVIGKVREEYGSQVFESIVNQNIKIEEAQVRGRPIFSEWENDRGAVQYGQLAEEILERIRLIEQAQGEQERLEQAKYSGGSRYGQEEAP